MIYFIRQGENGPIKIGRTNNIQSRLRSLQCASPYLLEILGVIYDDTLDEEMLHIKFSDLKLRGEWFENSQELLEFIKSNTKPMDYNPPAEKAGHQTNGKKYSDKRWLKKRYVDKQLSTVEIGKLLGCSHQTIWLWLKRHNIPIRTGSEAACLWHSQRKF